MKTKRAEIEEALICFTPCEWRVVSLALLNFESFRTYGYKKGRGKEEEERE